MFKVRSKLIEHPNKLEMIDPQNRGLKTHRHADARS